MDDRNLDTTGGTLAGSTASMISATSSRAWLWAAIVAQAETPETHAAVPTRSTPRPDLHTSGSWRAADAPSTSARGRTGNAAPHLSHYVAESARIPDSALRQSRVPLAECRRHAAIQTISLHTGYGGRPDPFAEKSAPTLQYHARFCQALGAGDGEADKFSLYPLVAFHLPRTFRSLEAIGSR